MSCHQVRKLISPFLDRRLAAEQQDHIAKHMALCRECSAEAESLGRMRDALRGMNSRPVPARLAAQLRVLASHERERRLARVSWNSTIRYWFDHWRLVAENMMRPLALPFAGGLLSALVLFSMLVPSLNFRHNFHNDVPIVYYTNPSLSEISPFVNRTNADIVVELTIDENGRVADYRVSEGEMTKELAADLLFSRFNPATISGYPTSGKFYLAFRRSRTIVVKG